MIIFIIIAALAGGGVGVYFIVKSMNKTTPTPVVTPSNYGSGEYGNNEFDGE
jgi:hypothetical protein